VAYLPGETFQKKEKKKKLPGAWRRLPRGCLQLSEADGAACVGTGRLRRTWHVHQACSFSLQCLDVLSPDRSAPW